MSDYQSFSWRIVDLGLDLRDAPDKVEEGRWVRLFNTRATQEALLTTRKGRSVLLTLPIPESVHAIKRLDANTLLIGAHQSLFHNETQYTGPGGIDTFSGNPISIIPYKPERGSEVWGYVADSANMVKVHADGRIFSWGISGPSVAAMAGVSGVGELDSSVSGAVGYDWRYTYYSSATGAESNGSPVMANKVTAVGQGANVQVIASGDPQVDLIRVYRRGGTIVDEWRLSVTSANLTGIVRDENSDEDISLSPPVPTENDVPFTTTGPSGETLLAQRLPYAAGPFIGKYILAAGDLNRPGYVYWTNPGAPDGASPINNVQVTSPAEPIIAVAIYGPVPLAISRDNFYALDFGQQEVTFRPRKTNVGRGLAAPWAFAIGPAIYFLSQDGIYETDGESPAKSITDEALRPIFNGLRVDEFNPVDFQSETDLRLWYAGQNLHFTYRDRLGSLRHLVWSAQYDRWHQEESQRGDSTAVYVDENQNRIRTYYGTFGGTILHEEDSGGEDDGMAIFTRARTGSIDLENPGLMKEWGNIIMDADPNGQDIVITPYLNAETSSLPPITITGTGRQKFARTLGDAYSHSIAFDFDWTGAAPGSGFTPIIYQFTVLYRPDEEAIRHWEFPETSHGLTGWQHIRDGYITARSTSELTFTITVDGVLHNVVFRTSSNTGGEKRKLFFDMPPTKGKLFRYIIDSPTDFRLYGQDCEVRLKPWNPSMGYQPVSPFRAEG